MSTPLAVVLTHTIIATLCSHRCIEINPAAEAPFLSSRSRVMANLGGTKPLLGGTKSLPSIQYQVASAGSDPTAFISGADVVIVDPPRKGLERDLLRALMGHEDKVGSGRHSHSHPHLCDDDKVGS